MLKYIMRPSMFQGRNIVSIPSDMLINIQKQPYAHYFKKVDATTNTNINNNTIIKIKYNYLLLAISLSYFGLYIYFSMEPFSR